MEQMSLNKYKNLPDWRDDTIDPKLRGTLGFKARTGDIVEEDGKKYGKYLEIAEIDDTKPYPANINVQLKFVELTEEAEQ